MKSDTPTPNPTARPTAVPTSLASPEPTLKSDAPSAEPSADPTALPTALPTDLPTGQPFAISAEPTAVPTSLPEPSASPSPVPTPALSSLRTAVSAPPTKPNNGSDTVSLRARTPTAAQSSDNLYYTLAGAAFGFLFLVFAACMFWRHWRRQKTAFDRWKEYDDAKTQGLDYRASNLQVDGSRNAAPLRLIETELTRRDLIPAAAPPLSAGGYGGDAGALQTSPAGGFMYANDGLYFGSPQKRPTAVESNFNPMMFAGDSPSVATDAAGDSQRVMSSSRPLSSAFARGGSLLGQTTIVRRLRPESSPPMAPTSEDPGEDAEWDKE